jgi:hypothetical protein
VNVVGAPLIEIVLTMSAFAKGDIILACLTTVSALPTALAHFGVIVAVGTHNQSISVGVDQSPETGRKALDSAVNRPNLMHHIHDLEIV